MGAADPRQWGKMMSKMTPTNGRVALGAAVALA
jgi:hypothetical protein